MEPTKAVERMVRVRGVIEHNGAYLFVKHAPASEYWALPGGHVEAGESIIEAIKREITEELGIEPVLGNVLYINQFFTRTYESLEFFFEITNGMDFAHFNLDATTHGRLELSEAAFINPAQERVLPEFLQQLVGDTQVANWPKVFVYPASDV